MNSKIWKSLNMPPPMLPTPQIPAWGVFLSMQRVRGSKPEEGPPSAGSRDPWRGLDYFVHPQPPGDSLGGLGRRRSPLTSPSAAGKGVQALAGDGGEAGREVGERDRQEERVRD